MRIYGAVFQSPSGVLGVCRVNAIKSVSDAYDAFQSPSGVLGVCRRRRLQTLAFLVHGWFQSPSGVLGVCRSHKTW